MADWATHPSVTTQKCVRTCGDPSGFTRQVAAVRIKAWIAGDPQHPGWSARRRERPVGSGPEWWVEYGVYGPLQSVKRFIVNDLQRSSGGEGACREHPVAAESSSAGRMDHADMQSECKDSS